MSSPTHIKSVTVNDLFDQFNHHIDFDQEESLAILYGPNGAGKSTLLRMLNSLISFRIGDFNAILFTSFIVELSDNTQIGIERGQGDTGSTLRVFINKRGFYFLDSHINALGGAETWIKELTKKIGHIRAHLIDADSLLETAEGGELDSHKESITPTIRIYAAELQQRLASAANDYARKSQELELDHLLLGLKDTTINDSPEQLKQRIIALQTKRAELRVIGLLPETDVADLDVDALESLTTGYAEVMSRYVRDSEEKLATLQGLSEKITCLLAIINSKFQGKTLCVDSKKGLVVTSPTREIDLAWLSSGEQRLLAMFYVLIFHVEPHALVMIDSPETSLHIAWQSQFVDDLKLITEKSKFKSIIVTHSPCIVGEHWDLVAGLQVDIGIPTITAENQKIKILGAGWGLLKSDD